VSELCWKALVQGLKPYSRCPTPVDQLTEREMQIFKGLGRIECQQIAEQLFLSAKTVERTGRERKKLNVRTAAELMHYAINGTTENVR